MTERLPPMPEPLAPEERALAARLARLGPHGEPSPALDARILAAARAEVPMPVPARKPARWPLAFGIAASVALAVGLAWQLRPLPEAVTYDEAASAVAAAESAQAGAEPMETESMEAPAADAVATVAAPTTPAEPAPQPAVGEEAPVAFQRAAAPAREAASGQSRVTDADTANPSAKPAPTRAYSAPPAPPAPPPAPVVPQAPPAVESAAAAPASAADMALPTPPAPVAGTAKARAPAAQQAAARDAAAAAERRNRNQAAAAAAESHATSAVAEDSFADEPVVEDIPPATADSPAVRDAWLHRIRELRAAGDTDAARASLREFARRYPAFPLPEDLRPLLD